LEQKLIFVKIVSIFGVFLENIKRWWGSIYARLPGTDCVIDVMFYAKSMFKFQRSHSELQEILWEAKTAFLIQFKAVEVLDYGEPCKRYLVYSVDVLQRDCEGMGCAILRGLMRYCGEGHDESFPRLIQFEAHWLHIR